MKSEQGSVTIMLCILFLAFIMLAGVFIDGARFLIAEVQVKRAAQTAINSVLAEYDVALKDKYGLFGFEASDKTVVNKKIKKYMERYLDPLADMDEDGSKPEMYRLWKYELPETIYSGNTGNSLVNRSIFERQVLEYMKYRAPVQTVEVFLNKLGVVFKAKESAELAKERNKVEKQLEKLDNSLAEIIKLTDGWYFDKKNNFRTADGYFVKKLRSEKTEYYYTDKRLESDQIQRIFGLLENDTVKNFEDSRDTLNIYYNTSIRLFLLKLYKQYIVNEVNKCLSDLKQLAYKTIDAEISELEQERISLEEDIELSDERISDLESMLSAAESGSDEYKRIIGELQSEKSNRSSLKSALSDLNSEITGWENTKTAIGKCSAEEFLEKKYIDYVKASNPGSETDQAIKCIEFYNDNNINELIPTLEESMTELKKAFSGYTEKAKKSITEYRKVCNDALEKLRDFENQTKTAAEMVDNYNQKADEKKDNLLPGDYDSAKEFVEETKSLLAIGTTDVIEQSNKNAEENGAIALLEKNVELLDVCLKLFERAEYNFRTCEDLLNKAQSVKLKGNFNDLKNKYKDIWYIRIEDTDTYESFLDYIEPPDEIKSSFMLAFGKYSEWKGICENLINEYRTDIKLNADYKAFRINETPLSQPNQAGNEASKNAAEEKDEAKEAAKEEKEELKEELENESSKKELKVGVIETLPSKQVNKNDATEDYDVDPDDGINMLDKGFSVFDGLVDVLTDIRDTIYFNEYIINMFRTAMDGKLETPRKDLRYRDIVYNEKSLLDYEVEYILYGKSSDNKNFITCVTVIFTIRTVMNFIHLYVEPQKKAVIKSLAAAAAGWWTGGLGIPVFQAIISGVWAMAESCVDVRKLLSGEEVAFFKGKYDWYTWKDGLIKESISLATKGIEHVASKVTEKISEGFSELKDFIKEKSDKLSEDGIKLITDKLNALDNQLNSYIDNAEQEFESAIYKAMDRSLNSFEADLSFLKGYGPVGEEIVRELENYVREYLKEKGIQKGDMKFTYEDIKSCVDDFLSLEKVKSKKTEYVNNITSKVEDGINKYKEEFQKTITTTLDELEEEGKEVTEDLKNAAVESITSKLDEIRNSKEFQSSFNIRGSLSDDSPDSAFVSSVRFSYLDYLRLFLLLKDKDTKIARTQDMVQISMMAENENFRLSSYQTAIKLDSNAKVNIMFLNLPFMPDIAKSIGEDGRLYKLEFVSQGSY